MGARRVYLLAKKSLFALKRLHRHDQRVAESTSKMRALWSHTLGKEQVLGNLQVSSLVSAMIVHALPTHMRANISTDALICDCLHLDQAAQILNPTL